MRKVAVVEPGQAEDASEERHRRDHHRSPTDPHGEDRQASQMQADERRDTDPVGGFETGPRGVGGCRRLMHESVPKVVVIVVGLGQAGCSSREALSSGQNFPSDPRGSNTSSLPRTMRHTRRIAPAARLSPCPPRRSWTPAG